MTKTRSPTFAILLVAGLLVAALVAVMLLNLREPGPDNPEHGAVSVVGRSGAAPKSPATLPSGEASRAPLVTPVPNAAPPAATAVKHLGPPMILLRVVDEDTGEPVPAFQVDILPYASEPPLERLRNKETRSIPFNGASGVFRAEAKSGQWDVVVRAADYLPGIVPDLTVPPVDATPQLVRLSHGPSITGVVFDDARNPVADVAVFLHVTRLFNVGVAPPRTEIVHTGGDGRFRFAPLPAGDYSLTLLESQNAQDRLPSVIVNQGATDVSMHLAARHQIVISVQDSHGRPVRDADVELRSADKLASSRTLESGQVVLRFLPDGEYTVKVAHEGYEPMQDAVVLTGGQGEQVRWYTLQSTGGG